MAAPMPKLSTDQAKEALDEIYTRFHKPENKAKLSALVESCNKAENPVAAKMMQFPALVGTMLGDLIEKYGFQQNQMMMAVMQIQMIAAQNPDMGKKVQVILQAFQGNIPDDEEEDAEICD